MRIAVMTPTYRWGGMDVQYASLMSQTRKPDVWVVADDLFGPRHHVLIEHTREAPFEVRHFQPRPKPEGYFSDLANIYNEMMAACAMDCDLAVSAQDYLWMPPDGIERFERAYSEHGDTGLLTGICSQSLDPDKTHVVQPEGLWTVYAEDYDGHKPTELFWRDVRLDQVGPEEGVYRFSPIGWELNWAAIPLELYRRGARFPEEFGRGIAHENTAFAVECMIGYDASVWIDPQNYAWSLPHKAYWPEQEASGGPKSVENMDLFYEKYGEVTNVL